MCPLGNTGPQLIQHVFVLSWIWGKNVAGDFSYASFDDAIPVLRSEKEERKKSELIHAFSGFYNFFRYNSLKF